MEPSTPLLPSSLLPSLLSLERASVLPHSLPGCEVLHKQPLPRQDRSSFCSRRKPWGCVRSIAGLPGEAPGLSLLCLRCWCFSLNLASQCLWAVTQFPFWLRTGGAIPFLQLPRLSRVLGRAGSLWGQKGTMVQGCASSTASRNCTAALRLARCWLWQHFG